ncbi:MAG: hypothetical protein KatS3mg060_0767 [Dehalococcoidia bacterium]|nr:MAG: hypothetical protein KatS3mg060_0767 [Dehalococcoidia bacterium]
MTRWLVLGALLFVVVIAAIAYTRWSGAAEPHVTGVVLEVQSQSLVMPDWFRLRDSQGREWRFRVDPAAVTDPIHPMNASHLRQHLALADPVTVYFRNEPDGPVAYRIVD